MGVSYRAVGWNRQKKWYDALMLGGLTAYLAVFVGLNLALFPAVTAETVLIRALGSSAFLLLHVILVIGPLCRLDPRFLPLLYNRRHMGVTMFVLALGHGVFSLIQFHALGDANPFVSVLVSNGRWGSLAQFPFQPLGALALLILFLMAATSHDFWLANLTAPVWKALHMLVYLAYGLLVGHVAPGILQAETSPIPVVLTGAGLIAVLGLHLAAGYRERAPDQGIEVAAGGGFVEACAVSDIAEKRACVVTIAGERVAVFKYDGRVSAVSNVCRHQNGPLGEGRIIDGCITCPWHGYQYVPETGASPPPFTETIPTFDVQVRGGRVWVATAPNPPGTRVEPARIDAP